MKFYKVFVFRFYILDSFREVKEYISEVNEYVVYFVDKIEVSLNMYVNCSLEKILMNMLFIL